MGVTFIKKSKTFKFLSAKPISEIHVDFHSGRRLIGHTEKISDYRLYNEQFGNGPSLYLTQLIND